MTASFNDGVQAMTVELYYLIWSAALTLALSMLSMVGASQQVGGATLAGNREGMPEITGWAGRCIRAHRNMVENIGIFAILVLTAKVAGISNAMTVLGAQLFFFARVGFAIAYILGVPYLRSVIYVVSVTGMVLIFLQLV